MRGLSAIGAAFLIIGAWPAASRADVMPTPATAAAAPAPGCHCPQPVRRVHRHVRLHRRHYRHRKPHYAAMLAPPPATYYNTLIPSPYDTAYDRAMVLHFRSPPVSGEFFVDPGYPPTPPVLGVQPYRFPAYGGVYQYDGLTGQYILLAQADAVRALPPPAPPPAASPAAR